MTSYTAEEIRRAFLDKQGRYTFRDADTLFTELRNARNAKADPGFTDTDLISVKELRDAYANVGDVFNDDTLLAWIREHREPDYPYGTVWKDDNGKVWFRGLGKTWLRFGEARTYPDREPKRPLKRMDVQ